MLTSPLLEKLIKQFARMPGIGYKTARRMAFHVLKLPEIEATELANTINELKGKITECSICGNVTENDPCIICTDSSRDNSTICVVEQPSDVFALEKTNEFKGMFHVLGGHLSPLDGIGPDDLRIKQLIQRIPDGISEVIIATNPNTEGEATAVYVMELLKPFKIKVTRIARGLPLGGDLEFADIVTLTRALQDRHSLEREE
ncbi:MAG: recombination protein RecR [candidate division Zixibacteria bacterium]|nr:recombination protein RecR [candidate division Zixibacteria bacterium]